MVPINDAIAIPDEELSWSYARAAGPGGQNVNKVASKAILRWTLAANQTVPAFAKAKLVAKHPSHVTTEGEFIVSSQEYRDQERNRERCLEKLAFWIRAALVIPKARKATKPSKASQRRRVDDKRKQGQRKAQRKPGQDD
jgi:ribosome-associated protein